MLQSGLWLGPCLGCCVKVGTGQEGGWKAREGAEPCPGCGVLGGLGEGCLAGVTVGQTGEGRFRLQGPTAAPTPPPALGGGCFKLQDKQLDTPTPPGKQPFLGQGGPEAAF